MLPVSSEYIQFKQTVSEVLKVFYKPFDACVTWIKDYRRDAHLLTVANEYFKQLTQLEMTPVNQCNTALLDNVKKLKKKMKESKRETVKTALATLKRHIAAQEYRQGTHSITTEDAAAYTLLVPLALAWKQSKSYFINKKLISRDEAELHKACQYPEFAKLLLTDPVCQDEFFRWTIVNDSVTNPFKPNNVSAFIKFPGLYQEILWKLTYRSARFGGEMFKVNDQDQVLTVPLEGEGNRVKVIKDVKMVLKGHEGRGKRTVTFQEIFAELNKRISNIGEGDFDITDKGGIWLWNAKKLAVYNEDSKKYFPINMEGDKWINRLRTQETLSYAEAKERYKVQMEGKPDGFEGDGYPIYPNLPADTHPLFVLRATQTEDFQFSKTHLFCEFLLVNRKTKTVEVKSLGEYMYPFPDGIWQNLVQLTKYSPSRWYNPDEAIFNGERQHAGDYEVPPVVVRPNLTEFVELMRSFNADILNGWKGLLGFNFVVAQCTAHLWHKARMHFGVGRIPDLRVCFWELNPKGPVRKLYFFLKPLPERIQKLVLLILGSCRSMRVINKYNELVSVSLWANKRPFKWIVHPAALFKHLDPRMKVSVNATKVPQGRINLSR